MAESRLFRWAVCPAIERDGTTRGPKLFRSELAASRFLNSEVRVQGELPPELARMSEQERAQRVSKRKGELKRSRAEAIEKHKRGQLPVVPYPLREILNKSQGWQNPVPVRSVGEYSGPKCDRTVRNFLALDRIGPMPAFNLEDEIARAMEGRSGDFACCLGEDWRFLEIDADAWRRLGHEYTGGRYASIAEIVIGAVHDIEDASLRLHPTAPSAAVGDFWRSWQVQRHIADFCGKLAESPTAARMLAGKVDAAEQVDRARWYVYRQLAVFAHELLNAVSPTKAGARRGYRQEVGAYMKVKGLRTNLEAARNLGVGVDTLKSIMSSAGQPRYSEDTLAGLLEKIGYKES